MASRWQTANAKGVVKTAANRKKLLGYFAGVLLPDNVQAAVA